MYDPKHELGNQEANQNSVSSQGDEILTIEDVSKLKKVPRSWVYARTRRRAVDAIPHFKFGKYVRFSAAEVDAYFSGLRDR